MAGSEGFAQPAAAKTASKRSGRNRVGLIRIGVEWGLVGGLPPAASEPQKEGGKRMRDAASAVVPRRPLEGPACLVVVIVDARDAERRGDGQDADTDGGDAHEGGVAGKQTRAGRHSG